MATVSYSSAGGTGSAGGGEYLVSSSTNSSYWSTSLSTSVSSAPLTVTQSDNTTPITIGSAYNTAYGTTTPITISSGGYVYTVPAIPEDKDEIKSKPIPTDVHDHEIQCRLRVESTKVISEYFCNHCETILFSKVISKIPKSIIKKQCLSRIVKGV